MECKNFSKDKILLFQSLALLAAIGSTSHSFAFGAKKPQSGGGIVLPGSSKPSAGPSAPSSGGGTAAPAKEEEPPQPDLLCEEVKQSVREGDLILIELSSAIFQRVARASKGWASHVGVVLRDPESSTLMVYESTIPRVVKTDLCKFIHHAKDDHFVIRRAKFTLSQANVNVMNKKAQDLMGKLYHTGFKFYSERQFCSKFVWELYNSAFGMNVGRFQTMRELVNNVKGTEYYEKDLAFWYTWYLGVIPWDRITVTPQSQVEDTQFYDVMYHPPGGDPAQADRVTSPSDDISSQTVADESE